MPGEFYKSNRCIVAGEWFWMLLVKFFTYFVLLGLFFLSLTEVLTYLVDYLAVVCELSHLLLIVVTFKC